MAGPATARSGSRRRSRSPSPARSTRSSNRKPQTKRVNSHALSKGLLHQPLVILFIVAVTLTACGKPAWQVVSSVASGVGREISQHIASLSAQDLVGVGMAGFAAQIVDGSLGMGYGVTSSTVLVLAGLSPATASASVHLAQLGTTGISGLAHHKFGNVELRTMWLLAMPGMVGAFAGATLLASIPGAAAKTITAALLFAMGLRILLRGGRSHESHAKGSPPPSFLVPLGLVGGFVDATGGGGWGPVATSGLLADGRLLPKRAIGTVSASEFFVTVAAVCGFFCALNGSHGNEGGVRLDLVLTLLAGGVIAAPFAPLFVAWLDARVLGVVVGGFVCLTTLRTLLKALGIGGPAVYAAHLLLLVAIAACVAAATRNGAARGKRKASGKKRHA